MARRKSDQDLVQELRAGREGSFEELTQRYAAKAFSLATRLTRNQEDAEEVLQDVFVTVYRKIHGFEGKSSFSSWLYRITVNASFMKLRKKRIDSQLHLEDLTKLNHPAQNDSVVESEEGDHMLQRKDILNALQAAIGQLPEDYRGVFVLRDVDGLTSKEVGKILKLSIPAVKSRLHRSRLMVRRRLAQFYREFTTGQQRPESMAGNC